VQQLLARTDQYGNRQVPQELEEIILKAIQPDKTQRYYSAEHMSQALQGIKILSRDAHLDQMFQSLSTSYPPPLFGTGDSKRYSSWRSYLYVNGKTNVGLLLPGAMQTTLNFMEKLLQQSSTRQLALDTLQDMKKQTMPQFALERLFDTRIEEILQKFQSQQKRIISP